MTGKLTTYVLREISQIVPPEEEITLMQAERSAAKARPFERMDLVVETLHALKVAGYRIGLPHKLRL